MKPIVGSSIRPLGTDGDQRRRFLFHHVPLVLGSALLLLAFMMVPLFDVHAYAHGDLMSGPFRHVQSGGGPMGHAADRSRDHDLIVLELLATSNDVTLRKLKAAPWKWRQRLTYPLFALVVTHAFFYGAFLRMASPFTLLLVVGIVAVLIGQAAGFWLWRRKRLDGARTDTVSTAQC